MTYKKLSPVVMAAVALMLGSCSILGTGSKGTTITATTPVTEQKNQQTNTTTPAPTTPATQAPATQAPATQAPATQIPEVSAPAAARPVGNQSTVDLDGQWLIVNVGSTTVDRDEDMPYIIFDPSGRFYANNGCNTVNGDYSLSQDGRFTFSSVMSTMRYCPDVDFQHAINVVLNDSVPVRAKFSEIGNESFIELLGRSGKTALRLRRANLDFLNGHWAVETVNGATVDVPADLFIDLGEKKIHGNTGCNYFNGNIYLDHRRPNAIDFSDMGLTRMACPNTAQETALMVALEQTTTALSGGNDRVMLLDDEGRELITLSRLPNP